MARAIAAFKHNLDSGGAAILIKTSQMINYSTRDLSSDQTNKMSDSNKQCTSAVDRMSSHDVALALVGLHGGRPHPPRLGVIWCARKRLLLRRRNER